MRKIILLAVCLTAALAAAGCGVKKVDTGARGQAYTVVDATGTTVTIPGKPQRILGNSTSIDTMLLSVVTKDKLVAAAQVDKDPAISYIAEDTKDIPLTYSYMGISMETITKTRPDLIVAATYTKPGELDMFRSLGIPVVVIDGPKSVDQVKEDVRLIAAAVDEKERGEKVVKEMDRQLADIDNTISQLHRKEPVVYLVTQMTRYGGPGSMFHDILVHAHLENAIALAGAVNGQAVSPEMIVKTDPDMLLVSTDRASDSTGAAKYRDDFLANPAVADMRAAKHIVPIDDRYIYSASQNCVWAIKALANAAYGEPLFDMSGEKQIRGY